MKTICLHPDIERKILDWFANRTCPAVFLIGPPGVGKTTLAYRVMESLNLRVSEFNASHTRSGACFRKVILPLLQRGGVISMMETGKQGGLGVILDEIDGLSSGEKGGLETLLNYLRAWKPEIPGVPMVLISNTIQQRKLQTISRYCLTIRMGAAADEQIQELLSAPPPAGWKAAGNGDLRPLLRGEYDRQGTACNDDDDPPPMIPEGVVRLAKWCLYTQMDPYLSLEMENNDSNLAGLVIAENLPDRLEGVKGDTREAWDLYVRLFSIIQHSDYADYWAFFYQTWRLLPPSQDMKLNTINLFLSRDAPWPADKPEPTLDKMRYTPVLTKQSALFNAWKLLCEVADTSGVPIRLAPAALAANIGGRVERKKKADAMTLAAAAAVPQKLAGAPAST